MILIGGYSRLHISFMSCHWRSNQIFFMWKIVSLSVSGVHENATLIGTRNTLNNFYSLSFPEDLDMESAHYAHGSYLFSYTT